MNKLRIAALGIAIGLSSVAAGSEESFTPWLEVAVSTAVPAPYGATQVRVAADASGVVEKIEVRTTKGAIVVPSRAFADVKDVHLDRMRTTFEGGYDPVPWFYVKLDYGQPVSTASGPRWSTLVIAIQDERVVYRALRVVKADGSEDWVQTPL